MANVDHKGHFMRNTIEGFNQVELINLKLNVNDAIFLRWMLSFIASGKTKQFIDPKTKDIYYWIKYSKVIEDLPIIFKNIFTVRRMIPKVASQVPGEKPLIMKLVYTESKGAETYFKFDPDILDRLENMHMAGFAELEHVIEKKPAEKDYKKIPVNANALAIFEKMKKIKVDDEPIFKHESPIDRNHYTVLYGHFQDAMIALHEGRFLTKYPIGQLEDWFQKKFKYYLKEKDIIEIIRDLKGSWNFIAKFMNVTIKNYAKWFAINTEQYDKSKLPRNINDWIYNAHNKTSMFYVSIFTEPTDCREADAEKVYNSIRPEYRRAVKELKKESFDGFTFWTKIKGIIKWHIHYYDYLIEHDSNCSYWLSPSITNYLYNYSNWLLNMTNGEPFLKNIGVGVPTWDLYIKQHIQSHGITIDVPRT